MRTVLLAVVAICGVWVGPQEAPHQPQRKPVESLSQFDLREIRDVTPITGGWLVPTETQGRFNFVRDPNHENRPK